MRTGEIDILLVEDNPGHAELVKIALFKAGQPFVVCHASRLSEALQQLDERQFDLVLLDLSLPDSAGLEGLSKIRDVASDVPVVMLTALASDEVAVRALNEGAQDYLVKDRMTTEVLERTAWYAIHRQQSRAEIERLLAKVQTNEKLLKKNRRLAKLYRMANQFVDDVSHEFRTPLTVIKEYVSLVREGVVGDVNEQQAQMLDTVSDRADDLNNMVDDMLDVSKLKAGVLGIWRNDSRIADIVERVRPGLERKASVKQVMLDFAIEDGLPDVYCDPEKVGRVIINLAVNAIKFSGEPGTVCIWAKRDVDSRDVTIGVTDNGPGIDDDGLDVIFQRFRQLGGQARGSTKGFGLGLSIAKELVDLNLGQMKVESKIGRGSTFSFTLPVSDPNEVVRRYLRHLRQRQNSSSQVTLVTAEIGDSFNSQLADDTDVFLNDLLRRNDLLFRDGMHQWLIVLALGEIELSRFYERVAKARKDANRNRPRGAIPRINLHSRGTWHALSQSDQILAQIGSSLVYAKLT